MQFLATVTKGAQAILSAHVPLCPLGVLAVHKQHQSLFQAFQVPQGTQFLLFINATETCFLLHLGPKTDAGDFSRFIVCLE